MNFNSRYRRRGFDFDRFLGFGKKRSFKGARAIVTGASSGIGREIALELRRRGADVAVVARREEPLRKLVEEMNVGANGSSETFYVVGDVCDPEIRTRTIAETRERFGGIDLLVNNAGSGAALRVEKTSETLARELFDVNFFAPFEWTKAATPALLASAKDGERAARKIRPLVVNLSSIVGVRGTPHFGVYGAAKGALLTLADAWRAEEASRGVDFLTVAPGTTSTEFFDVLRENRSQPYFPEHRPTTPENVAKAILDAAEKGKKRIIPYFPAVILDRLNRCAPRFVDYIMAKYAGDAY